MEELRVQVTGLQRERIELQDRVFVAETTLGEARSRENVAKAQLKIVQRERDMTHAEV